MSIIDHRDPQIKSSVEALCHHVEQIALSVSGDVEAPPERWDRAFDLWTFVPSDADLEWAAVELNRDATDYDIVSPTLSEADPDEFDTPEERSEYERWLSSQEPPLGELELRDVGDCFLGGGCSYE